MVWYCHFDWASEVDDRKLTTLYRFLLGQGPYFGIVKTTTNGGPFKYGSGINSFHNATKEAIWLQQLCKDIYIFHQVKPTTIFRDNQSCIALTQNPKFHARTKHVKIHHHFVCKKNAQWRCGN